MDQFRSLLNPLFTFSFRYTQNKSNTQFSVKGNKTNQFSVQNHLHPLKLFFFPILCGCEQGSIRVTREYKGDVVYK